MTIKIIYITDYFYQYYCDKYPNNIIIWDIYSFGYLQLLWVVIITRVIIIINMKIGKLDSSLLTDIKISQMKINK